MPIGTHENPIRRNGVKANSFEARRCSTYGQLIKAIEDRREALGLSQLAFDDRTGLPSGYQGKVAAKMRSLGPLSLGLVLQALHLQIVVEPIPDIKGATRDVVAA